MKYLDSITLIQFKNYEFQTFNFKQKCVAIIGQNGTGKTNLLDAIYYLCFTKSYFNKKEKNNILFQKDGFRISGNFSNDDDTFHIKCLFKDNKKSISNNDSRYEKQSDHIGFQTAVIIAPDDISIINGYSEDRRKFFDGILAQMDKKYLNALLDYQKILFQKNAYLKNNSSISRELIEIYNAQLAQSGKYIIDKRKEFTADIQPVVHNLYHTISENAETIDCKYNAHTESEILLSDMNKNMALEIMQKRALSGPHLDDWQFLINQMPIKSNGSQGQKKSFLLALKLSQIHLLNQSGHSPILLLDDIFEKLDTLRLNALFKSLNLLGLSQIFLTHTDSTHIDKIVRNHFEDIDIIELFR